MIRAARQLPGPDDGTVRRFLSYLGLFAVLGCFFVADRAVGQQATIATPQQTVSDSFFEHIGSSWGMHGKNWFFQFGPPGNPNAAIPPFGGFDPSAGANLGFGFGGGGWGGNFLGNFSQGSRRSFTSTTPSVTVQNGVPGFISDSSLTPFVISQIPVVGGFPTVSFVHPVVPSPAYVVPGQSSGHPAVLQALRNAGRRPSPSPAGAAPAAPNPDALAPKSRPAGPATDPIFGTPTAAGGDDDRGPASVDRLAQAQASSAGRPAPSVAQARRMHQADEGQQRQQALAYLQRGRNAESVGKSNVARIYYQMAARRAAGPLRDEILGRLRQLPQSGGGPP